MHPLVRHLPDHTHICRLTPPNRAPRQNNMVTILAFWWAEVIRPVGLCWLYLLRVCCVRFPLALFVSSVTHDEGLQKSNQLIRGPRGTTVHLSPHPTPMIQPNVHKYAHWCPLRWKKRCWHRKNSFGLCFLTPFLTCQVSPWSWWEWCWSFCDSEQLQFLSEVDSDVKWELKVASCNSWPRRYDLRLWWS